MKLVYVDTGKPVQVGDVVTLRDGEKATVSYFREPHKPASEGKVTVSHGENDMGREFYVSVIGARWIEREDRTEQHNA